MSRPPRTKQAETLWRCCTKWVRHIRQSTLNTKKNLTSRRIGESVEPPSTRTLRSGKKTVPQNQNRHKSWVFTLMKREIHTAICIHCLTHPEQDRPKHCDCRCCTQWVRHIRKPISKTKYCFHTVTPCRAGRLMIANVAHCSKLFAVYTNTTLVLLL